MSLVRLSKELGLSTSTVSRALNGYTDVSPSTRARVFEHAKKIGYQPSPMARKLASGKAFAIGMVLPVFGQQGQFMDRIYSGLLAGANDALAEGGYHVIATAATSPEKELQINQSMVDGGWVDGMIVARTRASDPRVEYLQRFGKCFVTFGRTENMPPHAWVDTDNEGAFRLATERLLRLGHERIAMLDAVRDFTFARLREKGYRDAMCAAGLEAVVRYGQLSNQSGEEMAGELLDSSTPPTALACATDAMAMGAYVACRARGLAIGRDISIIGYGNSDLAHYADPGLTTIEHHPYANGLELGKVLLRLLGGEDPTEFSLLQPVELVIRASDGPPRKP